MSESGSRGRSRGRGTFKNKGDRKQRDEEENGQQVKQRRVLSDEQKADFIAYQQGIVMKYCFSMKYGIKNVHFAEKKFYLEYALLILITGHRLFFLWYTL